MLQSNQDKNMRKHLNATIGLIISSEMPNQFPQIQEFIHSSLTSLYELLQQGQVNVLTSVETFNLLKTCKVVLKQLSKKRIQNQQPNKVSQTNLSLIYQLWDFLNTQIEKSLSDKDLARFEVLTVTSTSFDKILLFSLSTLQTDIQLDETVAKIISQLLKKLQGLIQLVKMVGQQIEVKQLLLKQIRCIAQHLISIQLQYPLSLSGELNHYLQIILELIVEFQQLQDDNILKCGILALYRVCKQFTYYSTPQQYQVTLMKSKLGSYQKLQQECYQQFYSFFTEQTIQEILNIIILKVLPYHYQKAQEDYTKIDDIIEKEDENYMDDAVNELENSIYNISMCAIEQILLRFSTTCLTLLSTLTSSLLQSNFTTVSQDIQDGIFSIIGLVPKICAKIETSPTTIIKIPELLQFLFNNHSSLPYAARRIPILVSRWINTLPESVQQEIVQRIIELIFEYPQKPVVRYECCMCLSDIVLLGANINYQDLISKVAPVIVQLFECFESPNILWKLISFLSSILQKCQSNSNNDQLLQVLQNSQLNLLLQTDSEMLRGALVDMFIDLILFFSPQTPLQPIFSLALQFINNQFIKKKVDTYILKLWYFIAKEYSSAQNLDEEMKSLLFRHIGQLSSIEDDDEIITKSLGIIEEYVLLEYIPFNSQEILQYVQKVYEGAKQFEENGQVEECIDIKTQALNLLGTAILIMLNRNEPNILANLQSIMKLLIVDLATTNYNKQIKSLPTFRAILQTIFNRFLISDFNAMIQFIQQCSVDAEVFLQSWFLNMDNAESKNASKINTIATLTILPLIPQQTFTVYFGYLLKRMFPDLHTHLDLLNGQTPPEKLQNIFATRSRKDEKVASARKKLLRKSQLYENFDLLNFFKTQIQTAFSAFNVKEADLPLLIEDQARLEQFVMIINSNN